MGRRYGRNLIALTWPFLLWLFFVVLALVLTALEDRSDDFPSPVALLLIPIIGCGVLCGFYTLVALRSRARAGARWLAVALNGSVLLLTFAMFWWP